MKIILTLILLLGISFNNFAQFGSSGTVEARSMGMAKTYNSVSKGVESIGINPANLMRNDENIIDFSSVLPLPSASIKTGTNFMSIEDFNYYFGGVLTEKEKQNFNKLFENGGLIFGNVSANLLSFSIKPNSDIGVFAVSINDFAGGKANIPQALVDIALTGNSLNKVYSLDGANIKSWWIRDYSFSYARSLNFFKPKIFDDFFAGFSVKLIHGYSYVV
ncbi:MAG: hypothetical protein ABI550_08525, partial [Ignavibacteriaceae bacterium]